MLSRLIQDSLKVHPQITHKVVSLTTVGTIGKDLKRMGIEVTSLNLKDWIYAPISLLNLYLHIRRTKPDIVQTWMYHADLIGGVVAKAAGVKNIIWGIRNTDIRRASKRFTLFVLKLCARLSSSIPKKIVCVAEASRRQHVQFGYDPSKMVVIHNGVDLGRFTSTDLPKQIKKELGISESEYVVGTVARFAATKDHATFIAAAAKVACTRSDVRFLMIGRGVDKTNPTFFGLIEQTGLEDRFLLLGQRSDVSRCLKAMDIFCVHSKTEGFPNALAEAMASGLPCISTDVGDAALVLGSPDWIIPSGDADILANAILRMLALPDYERNALGKIARQRVEENFTMRSATNHFLSLYAEITSK